MEVAPIRAVDVVIPCHNGARFLGEAIESVLTQGVANVRILLVDDGSTDSSVSVAHSFGAFVQVHSQAHAGIAAARNAGIASAQADGLAFLDADDVWTPGSLAARMERFAERPEADLVFGSLVQFHSPELDPPSRERLRFDPAPSPGRFAGTLLARRSAFLRVGLFDASLRAGEMIDWVSRAEAAALLIERTEHVSLRRRIHASNTMSTQPSNHAHYLQALKASIDRSRTASARANLD